MNHVLKIAFVAAGLAGSLAFALPAGAQVYTVAPAPAVVYPAPRPVIVYRRAPVLVARPGYRVARPHPRVRRVVYAGRHGCAARTTRVFVPGRGTVVRRVAGCR